MPQILRDLINNSTLLFALVFLYGALNVKPMQKNLVKSLFLGLLIGGFAILLMENPWKFQEGLIFDTRSVLISITGAFFSPLTTVVAASIGMVYRIALGGPGMYAGVATFFVSAFIGLLWQYLRHKRVNESTALNHHLRFFLDFWVLGIVTHLLVLICQVFLIFPYWNGVTVAKNIAPYFLGLFPLLSGVMAVAMINQIDRLNAQEELSVARNLLQASIDSPKTMAIFAVDPHLVLLAFNQFFHDSILQLEGVDLRLGDNLKTALPHRSHLDRFQAQLEEALRGNSSVSIDRRPDPQGINQFFRLITNPILDDNGNIMGATMFWVEVTEEVERDEENLYLSYHDHLTGLKNRRFYGSIVDELNQHPERPASVVIADINGLKLINDAFGHSAGDELLVKFAQILQEVFIGDDTPIRFGGDEFTVVLPGKTREETLNLVEIAKTKTEKILIEGLNVSVSFGVGTRVSGEPIHETNKRAEAEMYNKKLFELSSQRAESVKSILTTMYLKNPREEIHSRRVSQICYRIGELYDLRKDELNLLRLMGNLHDIGKISIDESILNKPGKLTPEEWQMMKRHPEIGYRILSASGEYAEIAEDILAHHERWDGKGYPKGLKGEEIPWRARIIAVADSFDAMTAPRTYRETISYEDALDEILRCAGTQFDPDIAKKFVEAMKPMEDPFK